MSNEPAELRSEVFRCELCTNIAGFERPPGGGPFYKFPPMIGAQGRARLLFIGINPRRAKSNRVLHDWAMSSPAAFDELAANRTRAGHAYIAPDAEEEHYHCHMIVVEGVFGVGTPFESVAAVTELFLCASASGAQLLTTGRSPCAERYLGKVVGIIKPEAVIAVGFRAFSQLDRYFRDVIPVTPIQMCHPAQMFGRTREYKEKKLQPTIMQLRKLLGGRA